MANPTAASTGILLVGHGARSQRGVEEFLTLAAGVARRVAPTPLEPGFLELAEPSIDAALAQLLAQAVRRLVVAPVLLFAAGHAKVDIPEAVVAALVEQARGDLPVEFAPAALGRDPAVLALSAARFRAAQPSAPAAADDDTCWILVARGSSDPAAQAEAHAFLHDRRRLTPVADAALAFLDAARPRLPEVLERASRGPQGTIVVQPHLLFHGELVERVRGLVAEAAQRHPEKQWKIAPYLGPADELAELLASRLPLGERPPTPARVQAD